MSWRPDNWENPYEEYLWQTPERYAFEEGADAMLTALMSGCELYVPANHFFTSMPIVQPVDGCWVFVPSNKEGINEAHKRESKGF